MSKQKINRSIKDLGLEIMNTRGDGYSYFVSLETGYQIGEAVYVCYMSCLTINEWIEEAIEAIKIGRA